MNTALQTVDLDYEKEWLNDTKETILFIPGLANCAQDVTSQLSSLETDFNYLIVSLRGRGNSPLPDEPISLDNQVEDVLAFMETQNIDAVHLCGHSVGVPIAIKIAEKCPGKIKSLILMDFAPFYPPFDKSWADWIKRNNNVINPRTVDLLVEGGGYQDVSAELIALNCKKYLLHGNSQFSALREKEINKLKEIDNSIKFYSVEAGHELLDENGKVVVELLNEIVHL